MSDRFRLDGRVALVTGASRGIGVALAGGLAEAGAHVLVAARDLAACEAVAAGIRERGGVADAFAVDLADRSAIERLVSDAVDRAGRLDVLVNNAGLLRPHTTVKVTEPELDELLAVNLKGPVHLSATAMPHLGSGGHGSIVNIGAAGASQPMEGIGAYCAVKAAMANWSITMAREWASAGVRVNTVVPGSVATDMILPSDPTRRAAFVESMSAQNLFGRLAEPDDLVGAVVFLASDASSYMTGRSVFVDGGLLR